MARIDGTWSCSLAKLKCVAGIKRAVSFYIASPIFFILIKVKHRYNNQMIKRDRKLVDVPWKAMVLEDSSAEVMCTSVPP